MEDLTCGIMELTRIGNTDFVYEITIFRHLMDVGLELLVSQLKNIL
jgi:hypothetical protein